MNDEWGLYRISKNKEEDRLNSVSAFDWPAWVHFNKNGLKLAPNYIIQPSFRERFSAK
jgi:hypothetical protein